MIVLVLNFARTLPSVIKEDVFTALVIVVSMLLTVGLAALVLWLRDRLRDWRGVPGWIREREEIKARRVGLAYRILWLTCVGIACSIRAFRVATHSIGFLLLLIAAIAFWLLWGDLKIFRGLNQKIDGLKRTNG